MSKRPMKCFIGNLDGYRRGLVIAPNQKEAARIAGTTVHQMRGYWNSHTFPQDGLKELTLYTQPLSTRGGVIPYIEGRCEVKRN